VVCGVWCVVWACCVVLCHAGPRPGQALTSAAPAAHVSRTVNFTQEDEVPSDFQDYSLVTLVGVAAHLMQACLDVCGGMCRALWRSHNQHTHTHTHTATLVCVAVGSG
jgi:hypothetical protein